MGVFTGVIPVWTTEPVTAADLDAMADALEALCGVWTVYTPVLTSNAGVPSLGAGTLTGRYRQVGKTVDVRAVLTWGAGTTYGVGGNPSISLPVTPLDLSQTATGILQDLGTNTFPASAIFEATAKMTPLSSTGAVSNTSPYTWASGDRLVLTARYEAA